MKYEQVLEVYEISVSFHVSITLHGQVRLPLEFMNFSFSLEDIEPRKNLLLDRELDLDLAGGPLDRHEFTTVRDFLKLYCYQWERTNFLLVSDVQDLKNEVLFSYRSLGEI